VSRFHVQYDYWRRGQAKFHRPGAVGLKLFPRQGQVRECHAARSSRISAMDKPWRAPEPDETPSTMSPAWKPGGAELGRYGLGRFSPGSRLRIGDLRAEWASRRSDLAQRRPEASKHFLKAYAHNGYFKSLEDIIHFLHTRDVPGAGWPARRWPVNVNTT